MEVTSSLTQATALLGASLEVDEGTVSLMKEDYGRRGIELNESRMKMATLPKPSEVCYCVQFAHHRKLSITNEYPSLQKSTDPSI